MGIENFFRIINARSTEHSREREHRVMESFLLYLKIHGGGDIDPFIAQMEAVGYSREELERALCNTDI